MELERVKNITATYDRHHFGTSVRKEEVVPSLSSRTVY